MNLIDLPTTWEGWLQLFGGIARGTALTIVSSPWWLLAALIALVCLTVAYTAPMGTDLNSPILTEDDRKAAR